MTDAYPSNGGPQSEAALEEAQRVTRKAALEELVEGGWPPEVAEEYLVRVAAAIEADPPKFGDTT